MGKTEWVLQIAQSYFCISSGSYLIGVETHSRKNKMFKEEICCKKIQCLLELQGSNALETQKQTG